MKCHSAGGRGTARIGPDLTGLSPKYDKAEIISSILEPSKRIVSGYYPVVVARTNGTVLTGLLRAETANHVELIDADLKIISIPLSDVEDRRVSEISPMPAGLADGLTPAEFADLVAYLQSAARANGMTH